MYKMTAAHPTLPIPSYARVTNLANDKSVIVRINDRGPFHSARVIDVSYTAALKLGLLVNGSSQLEVVHLLPSEIAQMMAARKAGQPAPEPAATATTQAPPALPKAAPMLASSDADKDAAAVLLAGGGSASATPTVGQAADVAAGFYLQVGAYSHANSAETLRGTLAEACSGDKFEVVKAGNVFRIFGGPHATRQDAADAIKRIPSSLRLKPIIIQR
jgi:rare lipoprotein A